MSYKDKYPAIMSARSETLAKFGVIDDGLSPVERNAEWSRMRKIADGFDVNAALVNAIKSRYEAGYYGQIESEKELNKGVVDACKYNILEMLEYLLNTKDKREKININFNKNEAFIEACKNDNKDILIYLILGEQIIKTKYIESYLKNNKHEYAESIFKIRELPSKDNFIETVVKI